MDNKESTVYSAGSDGIVTLSISGNYDTNYLNNR